MDGHSFFEGNPDTHQDYSKLANWLASVLCPASAPTRPTSTHAETDNQLELLLHDDYHLPFYQQLPDFIMALLTHGSQATLNYTPLLFHLAACRSCHSAYLDLSDALQFSLQPQAMRPQLGQGTRSLSATPQRMLAHLCQVLISQAETLLLQARHSHLDQDASARSLLQLALQVSSHIVQSSVRRQALQDLVRVATLFDGPKTPPTEDPHSHIFTPIIAGGGSLRRGKTLRRPDPLEGLPPKPSVILLQSLSLHGSIVQHDDLLELHLQDLAETLRGHYLSITVPLGSLLEPIRWIGGDPRSIRSTLPVDPSGSLVTPLGRTELQLSNKEEHNLLEAIFSLLEVRPLAK